MHKEVTAFKNKNILVIITGSIAAYKACEVIRSLIKEGARVKVMMSESSQKFIGIATISGLINGEVYTDLFPPKSDSGIEHVSLAIEMDIIIVLPATANVLCKVAAGIADDLISTTLSICEQPTIYFPAMNFRMWFNQVTIESVGKIRDKGQTIVEPDDGELATRHTGKGRLPNLNVIINEVRKLLHINLPLENKKVLVTAGPTQEAIDPVRYISNRSSGKMGYSIASICKNYGAEVTLISGPVNLQPEPGIQCFNVETNKNMLDCIENQISSNHYDYVYMAAAVSDYKPKNFFNKKIKRSKLEMSIDLEPCIDIIKAVSSKIEGKIIAFALESEDGNSEAKRKLKDKGADFIILNHHNKIEKALESDTNHVFVISKSGNIQEIKRDHKLRVAKKIVDITLDK